MFPQIDPRWLIHAAIIALTLSVIGLTAGVAWDGYGRYRATTRLVQANEMADRLIAAAGIHAMERGVTSAVLGAVATAGPPFRKQLAELRRSGDHEWRAAIEIARRLAAGRPDDAAFASALARAERSYDVLAAMRLRVDEDLIRRAAAVLFGEWIETITVFIAANARLRELSFRSVELSQDFSQLNLSLRHSLWVISEHAGLERGTLAYYVGARRPLPPEKLDELKSFRGVVDHSIETLLALTASPDTDPPLRQAIGAMERTFLGEFEKTRVQVYRAAATGNYPLSGAEWVARAQRRSARFSR